MKTLPLISIVILLLFSCAGEKKQQFEHAGGSIRMALSIEPKTYIARDVGDYYSATVLYQVLEGLVGMDPKTTKIIPKLATEWTVSDDGKNYTFTLRDDAFFHPHEAFASDDDRKVTTDDVIKTFELGCKPDSKGRESALYSMVCKTIIKGADDFYDGKADKISGLTTDGNKITIELLHEDHNFLYKLANINAAVVSKKIVETDNETDVIGTGPFLYHEYKGGDVPTLTLLKNNDYYLQDEDGNALPYLDSLVIVFQSRKLEQLDMFEEGEIDLIKGLPTSRITRMLEGRIEDFNSKPPKLILNNNALLDVTYYFFDMTDERFKDPKVRQAFSYAVDKEVIGREILRNQYYDLGYYGITPPVSKSIKGYDFKSIKEVGYDYDPEKAKKLLAEAGFPNGEGFGTVQLRYNIDDIHSSVADEFSKQIFKNLGINVNIDGSTFEQLIEDAEVGNGDIFRIGWTADYPSPESFLQNFYGKVVPENNSDPSLINRARYKNPLFDEFYDKAIGAEKMSDQMKYFAQAEVELMKDPPIIPLWYVGNIEITNSYMRNFYFNALNYMDFTRVYKKEWTEEEYKKAHSEANK
jgi:ABC-type oligopeptide transport system substrate-binding subunit